MRAVVFDGKLAFDANYADPKPAEGECLVRVRLAGICATDLHITRGYLAFRGVLGHEFVGTVVQGSQRWNAKRVACEINCVCRSCDLCLAGLANHCRNRTVVGIAGRDGCFADYVAVPERNLHQIPAAITDEEAVFVEPLAAAFQVLAQCPVERRMRVCVVGSGRLGLLVAQVLHMAGCRLTVTGRNRKKLLLAEKRGIQAIHVDELVPRQDHDVVVECTGLPEGLDVAGTLVRPRGRIVLKSTYAEADARNLSPLVVNEVSVIGSRCGPFPEAINALAREAVDVRPMISQTYPIEDALLAFDALQRPDNVKILLRVNT